MEKNRNVKFKCFTLYEIRCLKNNSVYVGVCSWYDQRICKHLSDLRNRKHGNCNIQMDYNEFGKESFEFNIILQSQDKNDLLRREKHLTDNIYRLDEKLCYNIISGGGDVIPQIQKRYQDKLKNNPNMRQKIGVWFSNANKGRKFTEEHKHRIRLSKIGTKATKETKLKLSTLRKGENSTTAKKCIDKSTGKIYGCLKYAAQELGMEYDTLRAMVNNINPNRTNILWL